MEITSFPLDYSFIILFPCGYQNPKARKRGETRNLLQKVGGKLGPDHSGPVYLYLYWDSTAV